ncbi:hypothetical protein [Yersinia pseudotuberculosis]
MMDITKSREEFEAWAEKNGYRMDLIPNSDIYSYSSTRCSWEAWQAARESIVVDIPEEMTCREALEQGHTSDYANGFTAAIIQCYAVVRTAGIRIKGESE